MYSERMKDTLQKLKVKPWIIRLGNIDKNR